MPYPPILYLPSLLGRILYLIDIPRPFMFIFPPAYKY